MGYIDIETQVNLNENCSRIYHVSLNGQISTFYKGSHFGSINQALYILLEKGVRDNEENFPLTPFL